MRSSQRGVERGVVARSNAAHRLPEPVVGAPTPCLDHPRIERPPVLHHLAHELRHQRPAHPDGDVRRGCPGQHHSRMPHRDVDGPRGEPERAPLGRSDPGRDRDHRTRRRAVPGHEGRQQRVGVERTGHRDGRARRDVGPRDPGPQRSELIAAPRGGRSSEHRVSSVTTLVHRRRPRVGRRSGRSPRGDHRQVRPLRLIAPTRVVERAISLSMSTVTDNAVHCFAYVVWPRGSSPLWQPRGHTSHVRTPARGRGTTWLDYVCRALSTDRCRSPRSRRIAAVTSSTAGPGRSPPSPLPNCTVPSIAVTTQPASPPFSRMVGARSPRSTRPGCWSCSPLSLSAPSAPWRRFPLTLVTACKRTLLAADRIGAPATRYAQTAPRRRDRVTEDRGAIASATPRPGVPAASTALIPWRREGRPRPPTCWFWPSTSGSPVVARAVSRFMLGRIHRLSSLLCDSTLHIRNEPTSLVASRGEDDALDGYVVS